MTNQPSPPSPPEYGPAGYLPERAAKRARKIVLREQMSAGWPLASVLAGMVLVVATILFLLTRTGPPGPPFEAVTEFDAVDIRSALLVPATGVEQALLVHTGSALRAFAPPGEPVVYCQASGHLESTAGSVWTTGGQHVGGQGTSLESFPIEVYRGTVYVDTSRPRAAPAPAGTDVAPACD